MTGLGGVSDTQFKGRYTPLYDKVEFNKDKVRPFNNTIICTVKVSDSLIKVIVRRTFIDLSN